MVGCVPVKKKKRLLLTIRSVTLADREPPAQRRRASVTDLASHQPTALRRAAAGLALLIVAALTAELTARAYDWMRYGMPVLTAGSMQSLVYRDSLTIRGVPGGRYKHFVLNRFGFRGPEIPATPVPGCTRVMALGASETFGFTESPGKNFVAQLADSLRPHGCFDVINAGIMGITGPNVIRFWTQWAARFKPDIVIFTPTPKFYLDDPAPTPLSPAHPQLLAQVPWWHSRFLDHLHDRLALPSAIQAWRAERAVAAATAGKPPDWLFRAVPPERMGMFVRDLDSLVVAVRASGAVPVLVAHATRYAEPLTTQDRRILWGWRLLTPRATQEVILTFERVSVDSIRRVASRRAVPLVDADRVMTGHREDFVDSQHFTDRGAGVMAGLVAHVVAPLAHRAP